METGDAIKGLIHRHNAVHGRALEGREAEIEKRIAKKEESDMADTRPLEPGEVECRNAALVMCRILCATITAEKMAVADYVRIALWEVFCPSRIR